MLDISSSFSYNCTFDCRSESIQEYVIHQMRGQSRIKKGNPIILLFRHIETVEGTVLGLKYNCLPAQTENRVSNVADKFCHKDEMAYRIGSLFDIEAHKYSLVCFVLMFTPCGIHHQHNESFLTYSSTTSTNLVVIKMCIVEISLYSLNAKSRQRSFSRFLFFHAIL